MDRDPHGRDQATERRRHPPQESARRLCRRGRLEPRTRSAGATATIRAAGLRQPAARLAPRSQSRCARAARPGVTPMKFILAVSAIALATAPTSAQNVASPKAPAPVAAPALAPSQVPTLDFILAGSALCPATAPPS